LFDPAPFSRRRPEDVSGVHLSFHTIVDWLFAASVFFISGARPSAAPPVGGRTRSQGQRETLDVAPRMTGGAENAGVENTHQQILQRWETESN